MPPFNGFAQNEEQAERKYKEYKSKDPFPKINCSVLNSADISDYIRLTGMVVPFDESLMKPATYGMKLLGPAIYWDEQKIRQTIDIKRGDPFIVKSNSIVFVSLEPTLNIPDYIIARFNLKIEYIYQGLLLGTGPIVDPGFCGKLSLPLHNLTNNDYELTGGNTLIWMEFTKITPIAKWTSNSRQEIKYGEYKDPDFKNKKNRTLKDYLKKAFPGSIASSLPNLALETDKAIKEAAKLSERVDTSLGRYNFGLVIAFGTLLGAIIAIVNVFQSNLNVFKSDVKSDFKEVKDKIYDERFQQLDDLHKKDSIEIVKIKSRLSKGGQ